MFKFNRLALAVVATSLTAGAFYTHAKQEVTASASVLVQNAFDFTEATPLNFGTITATALTNATGGTTDSITIFSDGTKTKVDNKTPADTNTSIRQIVDGAPGEFTIANAASKTAMEISFPADAELKSSVPGTGIFKISGFSAFDVNLGRGLTVNTNVAEITTDDTGAATFRVGAKLEGTIATGGFEDGTYSGTYKVTVNYK